jgi:hypothetical protein
VSLRTDFEVTMDLPIPDTQKLLLLTLLRHRNGLTGLCCPGIKLLMRTLRKEKTVVYDALRELGRAGYLTVEERGGGPGRMTSYVLHLPTKSSADIAPECAPENKSESLRPVGLSGRQKAPADTPVFASRGSGLPESQNNKELNTYEHSLTRRLPPQREKARGKFARVMENIERARQRRAGG